MLLALALSVINPAPRRLRRLGYVRQSGQLHARSRRCRTAWAPHLARARSVIAEAAEATRRRRHAVVPGSGLLDDVPLDVLAGRVERVCLITDTVQREEDRSGRITDRLDLLFGIGLPPAEAVWDWEIAPFGEIGRRHRLIHRVQADPDWKIARR